MTKRFRFTLTMCIMIGLLAMLSACGSAANDSQGAGNVADKGGNAAQNAANAPEDAPPAEEPAKEVDLTWVGWSGSDKPWIPIIQHMMDTWNTANPKEQVSWLGWPWDQTLQQILVRNQSKQAMDIGQTDLGWLKTLADSGALADLGQLFDKQWLADNFEPSALDAGRIDGVLYALPWTMSATSMVNNPTLLKKAGITSSPATIAEFEADLGKLKALGPDIVPYGMLTKSASASNDIQVWLKVFGGDVFDDAGNIILNNAAGVKTLDWYKSLLAKGYVKMDMARADARNLYMQDKVGFYEDSILAKGLELTNGVAEADVTKHLVPIPRPVVNQGDKTLDKMWGHHLVVFNNSPNKQQAADFIKQIVGKDNSLYYFQNGGLLPTMKSAIADPIVQNDPTSSKFLEITKNSTSVDTDAYNQKAALDNIIVEEFQAAMLDKKSSQQALDDAASRIAAELKK
ncbi:extracellular solute-binding protein [Paenibacillus glycinis]|uniref:Extracellular solute-binding protein n=1 Tax=Paenibacillus glycinis TaxID=2697035 RepID=A0ABW9XSR2_9BACL|nr:extracellular solute-binding protein [Paenibacillus glycinis]NBD25710.1 extracellular solute-binding protein [Paenibacillus glycinis]